MIKDLLPKTSYEKEALLKGLILFFVTMEIFLVLVFYLSFRGSLSDLKEKIFLELKNYSYTFEGEEFSIDIVPVEKETRFYELFEGEEGFYIVVPVPVSQKDALKIIYPRERYEKDLKELILGHLFFFGLATVLALGLSFAFSLYAINPLRKALVMIDEVTRDIVHDINTPLMTLQVNLKILSKKYKDEEISRAEYALEQLKRLNENLRVLKREIRLKMEEVNLKEIIYREIESLKAVYPNIKVESRLEEVRVKADTEAVRRIVANILENAFKYTSEGYISVSLNRAGLSVENPSKPVKNPNRLFERYYRESQRGLGLGLAIVKKLCTELGWQVKAEYKEGKFRIEVTLR